MQSTNFIPLQQAAKRLRLPFWDTVALIRSGRLRARLPGTHWWVERQSLNALVRQRERRAA